jgi:ornithine--oxo-acid transaminase
VKEGRGCVIEDIDGFKYIDCLMGYSSVNLGHHNEAIENEIRSQMSKIYMTARPFYNTRLPDTAKLIAELVGKDKVCIANGGVEAVETALKFARRWAYRVKKIPENKAKCIVAQGNFMGRTTTVCGASEDESRYKHFGPYAENAFEIIPYNDIPALEKSLEADPNICAVILEPIQGEGGIIIPEDDYLSKVYDLCKKHNVLYIDDEIQAGLGRTGKLFASDHTLKDKKPDMYLMAKSLTNGYYPVSIVAANKDIIDLIGPGEHGSTFSGNPLGMAIVSVALKELMKDNAKIIQNSFEMGSTLAYMLYSLNNPLIKEVRGRGLFIGIEFHHDIPVYSSDILLLLMEKGVASKQTHKYTIRLTPALNITFKEVEAIYHIFKNVLGSIASQVNYLAKEPIKSNFLMTKKIKEECDKYLVQDHKIHYEVRNPKQEAYKLSISSLKIDDSSTNNDSTSHNNEIFKF